MVDFSMWDEFVDKQAREFCKHAEKSPRLNELASRDYNSLSSAEKQELLRLFDYAALSFASEEEEDWWR